MAKKEKTKVDMRKYGVNTYNPPWILYLLLLIFSFYVSLRIASGWNAEDNAINVISNIIIDMTKHPFEIHLMNVLMNIKVFLVILLILMLSTMMYILLDLTKERKFKPGREYGTAKWITAEAINRKFEDKETPTKNRICSQNIRVSMDKKTGINNNTVIVGGSGAGKSFYYVTPNIYQANPEDRFPGSFIITDPKGELLSRNAKLLKEKGYKIRTLNLMPGMLHESDCFNLFDYIRDASDILTLIQNLQDNTDCGEKPPDPFWPKAESMFLNALFLAVWVSADVMGWERNFNQVVDLVHMAQINDKGKCTLDDVFLTLVARTKHDKKKGGERHPAYIKYNDVMSGAADTKRSVLITVKTRLNVFDDEGIRRILSKDELDLSSLGTGEVDGKTNVKTALFVITPDSVTTFNCIAGMMYTLIFKEMCFQADFACKHKWKGELPIPVTFCLDEFKNIVLPPDFLKMLATIRSRYMSAIIIVQNITQLKELYDEAWEEVPGNCDTMIYLGGNEYASFEYISKLLGNETFYKMSQSESRGQHGSYSKSTDALGGELMRPDQVRMLDNDKCIVLIRGTEPCIDYKMKTWLLEDFKRSEKLGDYVHSADKYESSISFATPEEISKVLASGDFFKVNLNEDNFISPDVWFLYQMALQNQVQEQEELERQRTIDINDMTLFDLLERPDFVLPIDQYEEVIQGINDGLSDEQVKSYILYNDVERMKRARLLFATINKKAQSGGDIKYANE